MWCKTFIAHLITFSAVNGWGRSTQQSTCWECSSDPTSLDGNAHATPLVGNVLVLMLYFSIITVLLLLMNGVIITWKLHVKHALPIGAAYCCWYWVIWGADADVDADIAVDAENPGYQTPMGDWRRWCWLSSLCQYPASWGEFKVWPNLFSCLEINLKSVFEPTGHQYWQQSCKLTLMIQLIIFCGPINFCVFSGLVSHLWNEECSLLKLV